VAIIPYTYEHTVFHTLQVGDPVNLEFDILGKYAAALLQRQAAFATQAPSRA
jgi:riboflavin synthase